MTGCCLAESALASQRSRELNDGRTYPDLACALCSESNKTTEPYDWIVNREAQISIDVPDTSVGEIGPTRDEALQSSNHIQFTVEEGDSGSRRRTRHWQ